jgi:hypothetical protein
MASGDTLAASQVAEAVTGQTLTPLSMQPQW